MSCLVGALLAAPTAAAQAPSTRSSGSADPALPPMPSPPPVNGTPPNVRAVGSASPSAPGPSGPANAVGPGAPASTPVEPAPPAPAGMPGPQGMPNAGYAPAPAAAPDAGSPGDRYGVAVPPKRGAWGDGTTLLRRDTRVGVYIGPTFKVTSVNRLPGLLLGADLGVLLGERFAIGAAGSAIVTPLAAPRSDGRTLNLRVQYAGVVLGVEALRVKFFSLGLRALLGGGRVCLNDERLDRCVNRAAMFVAEPEITLSFAVTKVLRLVLSGGYRFAVAQAWSGPSDRLLGGFTGTLGLRLGKF